MRDKKKLIEQLKRLADNPAATIGEKENAFRAIDRLLGLSNKNTHKEENKWWDKSNLPSIETRKQKDSVINITFPETTCTEKQYRFMFIICRYYGFTVPPREVSFEFAYDFLNRWAPLFRESMGWSHKSPITGYDAWADYKEINMLSVATRR